MLEVITEAISGPTLPFTILLGLVLLYWILVGLGLFHVDSDGADGGGISDLAHAQDHGGVGDVAHAGGDGALHGASDGHADSSHHDHSPNASLDNSHTGGFFKPFLNFLNIGDVPVTVVLSFLALFLWVCSMILNHYLNPNGNDLRALILLVPNFVASLVATSLVTRPFKKLYRTLNRDFDEHKPVLGRLCTISTSEATETFGQAVVERDGAPLVINVRTFGDLVLKKGDQALIIKEDPTTQIFTVAKLTPQTPQPEQQEKQLC